MYFLCEEKEGVFYLSGVIGATFEGIELFQGKQGPFLLNMKDIHRINSIGIQNWMKMLRHFPEQKFVLEQCPYEVINQINILPDFFGNNQVTVTSFYTFFFCEDDNTEASVLLLAGDHYTMAEGITKLPEIACSTCGKMMELDDEPEKYFGFLGAQS